MDQGATQGQFLFHAARKFSGTAFLERLDLLVDVLYKVVVFLDSRLENGGKELHIFFDGHVLVQRKTPRHIADMLTDFLVILHYVKAIYNSLARICKQQRRQYAEQRGFSGSIRADNAKNFALIHIERHATQSAYTPLVVGLHQIFNTNYRHCNLAITQLVKTMF